MLTVLLLTALAGEVPAELADRVRAFESRTGVQLRLPGHGDEPLPANGDRFGPVDPALARKALPHLQSVLEQYPNSIRGGLLQDLHLFGRFQPGGVPYLAMSRPKLHRIDLAVRPNTRMAALRSTLHHEIGHLLELNPAFPADRWTALSASYAGRLRKQQETKGLGQSAWLAQGFISRYASKNRHEDFAELAQFGFQQPGRLRALSNTWPALGAKVELMTEVYRDLAPGLDLPWTPGPDPAGTAPVTREIR